MLSGIICFSFLVCNAVLCAGFPGQNSKISQTFSGVSTNSFTSTYTRQLPFHPHAEKPNVQQYPDDVVEVFFHDSRRNRHRRGIVLIDEDFDKLPDVGIRQGWSDGELEPVDKATTDKVVEKVLSTEEGSGGSSLIVEASTAKFFKTPSELQRTKENLRPTKKIPNLDDGVEGSGEDMPTPVPTEPVKEWNFSNDSSLPVCLNTTCDSKQVKITPGFAETVAEEASLILSCTVDNFTGNELLRWYKNNGSNGFLLETSASNNQLHFAIPEAKERDSGVYVCVRLTETSCCHRRMDVTVYKKPNYKYHLLIIGLVAGVSLFTCLLLGIHRRHKIKQYKKETKTQIPMSEFLL